MNMKKAMLIIAAVLVVHWTGLFFGLYELIEWYDVVMHFAGGFAMGALGLAIWEEGVEEVRFKGWFENHLKWWLVPGIVLGFVSLIGIVWELHEWLLDVFVTHGPTRQPSLADTMADFVMDLLGGVVALIAFWRR